MTDQDQRFASYDDYLADDPRRCGGVMRTVGDWWRTEGSHLPWTCLWVETTGELIIRADASLGAIRQGQVELLAVIPEWSQVGELLEGWELHHHESGSLDMLRRRCIIYQRTCQPWACRPCGLHNRRTIRIQADQPVEPCGEDCARIEWVSRSWLCVTCEASLGPFASVPIIYAAEKPTDLTCTRCHARSWVQTEESVWLFARAGS